MLLPHRLTAVSARWKALLEASATTPYHFLLQSELSRSPSRAQRDLPYSPLDIEDGVGHLQDLGVRYYMAFTDEAVTAARADPRLTELTAAEPWVVFSVRASELVVGLDHLPVVVDGVQGGGEAWLVPTVAWWEADEVPLIAETGPDGWPRISIAEIEQASPELQAAIDNDLGRSAQMLAMASVLPDALPDELVDPVVVSDVTADEFGISFAVDRLDQPVLVRTSYFPNWEVSGALGPFRVAPNLMVVVPTEFEVELAYGRSGIELFSQLLTVLGVVVLFATRRLDLSPGRQLWDLGISTLDRLPDGDLVRDQVQPGRAEPDFFARLAHETGALTRAATARLFIGLGLVVATIGLHFVLEPTTEDVVTALWCGCRVWWAS